MHSSHISIGTVTHLALLDPDHHPAAVNVGHLYPGRLGSTQPGGVGGGKAMIALIDDHRGAYGVEPICKVLPIAPSTYRAQIARRIDSARLSPRARRDLMLAAEIR